MLGVRRIMFSFLLPTSSIKADTFFAFQPYIQTIIATELLGHFVKSAQQRKVSFCFPTGTSAFLPENLTCWSDRKSVV